MPQLIANIGSRQALIDDVTRIAATLGCVARPQGHISLAIAHRPGERNGVIDIGWKPLLRLVHQVAHALCSFDRISSRQLVQSENRRGLTV